MQLTHKNPNLGTALGFLKDGKYDKLACIPDYDAGTPEKTNSGRRVIRFHGDATYEILNPCEYGCGYHCQRIWYRGTKRSRAAYQERVAMLCR